MSNLSPFPRISAIETTDPDPHANDELKNGDVALPDPEAPDCKDNIDSDNDNFDDIEYCV